MTTATLTKNIPLERKVDIIFNYLLKHKEQLFWNSLNEGEQKEIKKREKGKFEDFDKVRKEIAWK